MEDAGGANAAAAPARAFSPCRHARAGGPALRTQRPMAAPPMRHNRQRPCLHGRPSAVANHAQAQIPRDRSSGHGRRSAPPGAIAILCRVVSFPAGAASSESRPLHHAPEAMEQWTKRSNRSSSRRHSVHGAAQPREPSARER